MGIRPRDNRRMGRPRKKVERNHPVAVVNVLGENLERCQAAWPQWDDVALAKRAGTSPSTVARLRNGEVAAGIDTLEAIASAFGLRAWQMMVPGLEPTSPPMLAADVATAQQVKKEAQATLDRLGAALERLR